MISYRQADLINRIRKYNTYKVIFVYDEALDDVDKFQFYSFDHVDGNTSRDVENENWETVHDVIPTIIEKERGYLYPMNLENARTLVRYIVNSFKNDKRFISGTQTGEEIVPEVNSHGARRGVHRFLVEVTL